MRVISFFYYATVSKNVSSRHLSIQTHFKSIVKKELVDTYGLVAPTSALGARTLHVAQQPSSFSILNTEEVSVTAGSLLVGIANGVAVLLQVYSTIGLVLLYKVVP